MMYNILFLCCSLCLISLGLNGQTFQVFSIKNNEIERNLLRLETYESGRLVQQRLFGERTQPLSTIQLKYNKKGALEERKQTFHEETAYDLIRQYTYDEEGLKTGELFGNNRTGKWGSFRYSYTALGAVDTTFIFQKNGDLTDLRITDYTYDEQQRKVQELRYHKKVVSGKITLNTTITYEYLTKNTIRTTISQPNDVLISTEVVRKTDFNKIAESIITLPNMGALRLVNFYDDRQQVIKTEEFENDVLIKTTTYQYDQKDQLKNKKFIYSNGEVAGEHYKLLTK